jgi:environmental stress-induced protein Ves
MRHLGPADYRVMPWKDGGGVTTEVYARPDGGTTPGWAWRVSIADVSADGPFSRFSGYDRHIMCIEGSGMILHGGPDGPIDVGQRFVPRRFSGDWPIQAALVSEPIRDFNLIVRSADWIGSLTSLVATGSIRLAAEAGCCLAYSFGPADGQPSSTGRISAAKPWVLHENSALLLESGEEAWIEGAAPVPWRYAVCRLVPV